jgi:hypothetical protein
MEASVGSRGWRGGLAVLLAAAVVVGCGGGGGGGGDDKPTAAERAAELKRWAQRADAICEDTEREIALRGGALDVIDLDRVAMRAVQDVEGAIAEIRRLRVSPEARAELRPLLEELDRLEPRLTELTRTTEDGDMDALLRLAIRLETSWRSLSETAGDAGLLECGREEIAVAVSDALVAPVFATKVAAFEAQVERSVRRSLRRRPRTPAQAAAFYRRLGRLMASARERWDALRPPERARDAAEKYDRALAAGQRYAGEVAARLDDGRVSLAWARTVQRRFRQLGRAERTAMRRLRRIVESQPLPVRPPARRPPARDEIES